MTEIVRRSTLAGETAQPQRTVYPVILCGGSGKRLWPVSRQASPKQFQRLNSEHSLLQETALRARDALGLGAPLVLCNEDHRDLVQEHLRGVGIEPAAVVCEPAPRNTAAALATAALILHEQDPDAIMMAMPADHCITDPEAFARAMQQARAAAERGLLVTFGIAPDRPETGYGYIEQGADLEGVADAFGVARFVEKPAREDAERLIATGRYLWNSGMFLLPAAPFLEELGRHSPETDDACRAAHAEASSADGRIRVGAAAFARAPNVSVDVAVMERTTRAAVVRAEMGWSDIGTWPALRAMCPPDADGNVVSGNVVLDEVTNSYIRANGRLVAAVGLDDVVIVDTEDAVLVGSASQAVKIDRLVAKLAESGRSEVYQHPCVHRPWGTYQTVDRGERFQVKHIMVKPGEQLSLQLHHHRAEHWVIVSGTGRITRDGTTELLHENQHVHIPVGASHRLENPGMIPLELIEVQVGPYLGEDDIVRLEDRYGRV